MLQCFSCSLGFRCLFGLDGVGGMTFVFLRAGTHPRAPAHARCLPHLYRFDLIPAMIFAVALSYFEIGIVFVILGTSLVIMGALAFRYLPEIHVRKHGSHGTKNRISSFEQRILGPPPPLAGHDHGRNRF